jgi:hypothetical protein
VCCSIGQHLVSCYILDSEKDLNISIDVCGLQYRYLNINIKMHSGHRHGTNQTADWPTVLVHTIGNSYVSGNC